MYCLARLQKFNKKQAAARGLFLSKGGKMLNLVKWILQELNLIKKKDRYVTISGVKYRVVAEPYPPPDKKSTSTK
jgi:hypothetical protein